MPACDLGSRRMGDHDANKLLPILALGLLLCPAGKAGETTGWDVQAAARYLDARAAAWSAFQGADRGQGADKVSCLSCHTSVPYALGRPALRRVAGDDRPTTHETRLLEHVRRRLDHWRELDTPRFQLSYDFDERKKVESRGTEAVLNALVLARDDRRRGLAAPSDSTRRALRHLWAAQRKEGPDAGSWDWLDFGLRPWEAGASRSYGDARAGLDRLRRYLSSHFDEQDLHNRLYASWASTAVDGLLTEGQRWRSIEQVREEQQPGGGWSLSSLVDGRREDGTPREKAPDGYATGLAVHLMRLAGLRRDHPSVARGLAWLRANQQPGGNWVGFRS